ncbi:MAG: hypothetical protein JNN20_19485 [Betaproteobacteria bacterium]|nr:hypothetical protein [Betaproteobacteria bacterium]
MIDPATALAAQRHPIAGTNARHRILSIGNAGALGESVISNLLASSDVELLVVADKPVRSTARRLAFFDLIQLEHVSGWPPLDAVVILVGGKHSYFKRDDAFPLLNEADALTLARNAASAGVKQLLLVAPMDAWLSATLSSAHRFGELEAALRKLDFEKLVVVRPGTRRDAAAGGSALQRIANVLLSTLGSYMTPQRLQPLRAQTVAQAALAWFAELPAGQHFLGAADFYQRETKGAQREHADQIPAPEP